MVVMALWHVLNVTLTFMRVYMYIDATNRENQSMFATEMVEGPITPGSSNTIRRHLHL